MTALRCALLWLAFASLPAFGAAAPDERQCAQAIAMAQKTLNEMPAKNAREQEDLQKLRERQEKLIADGRRNGVNECRIWTQVMGLAFNQ